MLSSFVIGLAVGLWAGSSSRLASQVSANGQKQEAVYEGRPAGFWVRQLQDRAPAFRQQAIQALEQIGPKDEAVVPALAGMLQDRNAGVRMGAALALRRLGPEAGSAVPALIAALKDENQHVRFDAVCALADISPHDEAVLAALVATLQADPSPMVRVRILKTLAEIAPGSSAGLSASREALKDSEPEVCQAAAGALDKIKREAK